MATINTAILTAAHADRLLSVRLTETQIVYLHPTVITANRIYWAIADAGDRGLDLQQLEQAIGVHYQTIAQFTRWMVKQELLYIALEGEASHRPINVYYVEEAA